MPCPISTSGNSSSACCLPRSRWRSSWRGRSPAGFAADGRGNGAGAAGVEFGKTNSLASLGDSGRAWQGPTGRSFLFNELNGRLLIRATADEHALVTNALGLLLPVSQLIQIEAKFIEITEPLQMSFDWFLGNQLIIPETNARGTETTATGIMTDPMFSGMPARAPAAEVRGDQLDWAGRSDPDAHIAGR
jgi:hypothetical protein